MEAKEFFQIYSLYKDKDNFFYAIKNEAIVSGEETPDVWGKKVEDDKAVELACSIADAPAECETKDYMVDSVDKNCFSFIFFTYSVKMINDYDRIYLLSHLTYDEAYAYVGENNSERGWRFCIENDINGEDVWEE